MKMTGAQIIMKYLETEHVPYILGIPGHGVLSFFDAVKESDQAGTVRYIQVKQEQAAVHMADGYYRTKGEPLAVFTSIGPGALNTVIGLATAYVDSVPVFQVSGDTHTNMKGVGVLQEIERVQDSNFIRILEPVTKRCWRVESAGQLPRIMQRAFNLMESGRKGPVAIALPMDVGADDAEVCFDKIGTRMTASKPAGDGAYIRKAVELMKAAKRPVILAGGSVLRSRMEDTLVELAELWGAAVVTTMAGKSAFPEDHPLNGYHTGSKGTPVGMKLTQEADVILALGTRFADETTSSYRDGISFSFPKTRLIQVDIEPVEIGKNYPCDCGIIGDVSVVARQLIDACRADGFTVDYKDKPYTSEIMSLKEAWAEVLEKKRSVCFELPTISQVVGILNECLPANTIISTSSGNSQAQLFQEYCFKNGQKHLTTGGFSTMGWAFPAAMGAKLACPEKPVVAFLGDGDFMMTMQELSTMAQYDIPVVVIVVNNMGWMAIKDLQADVYGEDYTFGNDFMRNGELYSPDFAAIARDFGVQAESVDRLSDVRGAVCRAVECGKPALVEVRVHREYPESGGRAYGWWDVPVPAYMKKLREGFTEARNQETV